MAASLTFGRRALPLLALAAAVRPAVAATIDLSLACDTTLAPALRKVAAAYAAKTGVRVFVFPTGPGLLIPQLERNIQNDILVTQLPILQQASDERIIAAVPGAPLWSNPLVIAGRSGASADGVFAACDPTAASDFDGPVLLAKLEMKPAQVMGAVDTDEVAWMLQRGEAQAGFLHMTDVRTHPELTVIRTVPDAVQAPFVYAATVTKLASRPNPQGFVAFLQAPEAGELLKQAGLEAQT
ncbi:MAG TPA: substrate-binding domain-containing protein [Acetobacteraceae bacterium]|jgi:molybdate transport system substrate-binding protein|nr:substrate-binding domain-containing protein [Acetobacteraceae bacterium]